MRYINIIIIIIIIIITITIIIITIIIIIIKVLTEITLSIESNELKYIVAVHNSRYASRPTINGDVCNTFEKTYSVLSRHWQHQQK